MGKPRVAIYDFACCEGCQLQIVNLEEEILDLITLVQPVRWREAMAEEDDGPYDILMIEGSITRPEDEERVRELREKAPILVALGACATIGGINRIKNNFDLAEVRRLVYGERADMPHLNTGPTKAVNEVVPVDYYVHGCPMTGEEFGHVVRCLALGREPDLPTYPVCVECKARGTVCRYEYNEICLGVVTRAGCNAPCPAAGMWCYGCRGLAPNPNVDAAREVMETYGKTVEDLQRRLTLFNSQQEPTHVEHR
ncbi:MAG: cytochrome B [Candidatus Brocadiaceae bacterium]|nr:cytochrome B [Candidatus Brocadiaceae bacterium]